MLKQQVAVRISEVNLRAGDHDSAAAAALESHPGVLEGLSGKRVLLVGQAKGSAMARAVKKACGTAGKLLVWSRSAPPSFPGSCREGRIDVAPCSAGFAPGGQQEAQSHRRGPSR